MISILYSLYSFFYWMFTGVDRLPPHLQHEGILLLGISIMVEVFIEFLLTTFIIACIEYRETNK